MPTLRYTTVLLLLALATVGFAQPPPTPARQARLEGMILAADGQTPVGGVTVAFEIEGTEVQTTTDAEGRFTFEPPFLGSGRLRVYTAPLGLDPFAEPPEPLAEREVKIADRAQELVWTLPELPALLGRVAPAPGSGRIPQGLRVRLEQPEDPAAKARLAAVSAQGHFAFLQPGPAPWRLVLLMDENLPPVATMEVEAREAVRRTLTLTCPTLPTARGRVFGPDGIPVAYTEIRLLLIPPPALSEKGVERPVERSVWTDGAGRFILPPLPPGQYRLVALTAGRGYAFLPDWTLPAAAPPPLELHLAPSASLSGVVLTTDETPLPGVTVQLFHQGGLERWKFRLDPVTTDAEGRFAFPNLPPGTYDLQARTPDRRFHWLSLALKEGEVRENIRVAFTPVEPGEETLPLHVHVQRPDGTPVPGARVALNPRLMNWGRADRLRGAGPELTDAGGRATFAALAGQQVISVRVPGEPETLRLLTLAPGEATMVAVTLLPAAGRVAGRVDRAPGVPWAGARVLAVPSGYELDDDPEREIPQMTAAEFAEKAPPEQFTSATTDAEGNYLLGPLTPGEYLVVAYGDGPTLVTTGVVVEEGQTTAGVDLAPALRAGALRLSFRDTQGQPLPNLFAFLRADRLGRFAFASPVRTDAQGTVRWEVDRPGRYTLFVQPEGYEAAILSGVLVTAEIPEPDVPVVLQPLERVAVEVVVKYGEEGPPAAGVAVTPVPLGSVLNPPLPRISGKTTDGSLLTDATGRARFPGLWAGRYVFRVQPGDGTAPDGRAYGGALSSEVTVAPGLSPVTVALPLAGELLGRVVDLANAPLSEAQVRLWPANPRWVTEGQTRPEEQFVQPDGTFRFIGLTPMTYRVSVSLPYRRGRYLMASQTVAVPLGQAATVEFRLNRPDEPKGGYLIGQVWRPDGTPAAGAWVTLDDSRTGVPTDAPARATTDGAGRFAFSGVTPGPHRLAAWWPGAGIALTETLEVRVGETVEAILELPGAGTVAGRVKAADGVTPLAGARVWAVPRSLRVPSRPFALSWSPFAPSPRWARSDATGAFTLRDLTPGRYLLAAEWDGLIHTESVEVTVQAGETRTDVCLSLGPLVQEVTGCVTGPDGAPRAGAVVQWEDAFGQQAWAETDADGRYTLAHLSPGLYRVRAMVSGLSARPLEVTLEANGREGRHEALPLQLVAGGSVTGRVVPPPGVALPPGSQVVAEPAEGAPEGLSEAQAEVNHDGTYRLMGLVPGLYRVSFRWRADTPPTTTVEVKVQANEEATAPDLVLGRSPDFLIRVRTDAVDNRFSDPQALVPITVAVWNRASARREFQVAYRLTAPDGTWRQGRQQAFSVGPQQVLPLRFSVRPGRPGHFRINVWVRTDGVEEQDALTLEVGEKPR